MARTKTPDHAHPSGGAASGRADRSRLGWSGASWVRAGGVGIVCLALGIVLGTALQKSRPATAPVVREVAEASRRPVAPATFADIVDAARPGVVSVRALLVATPTDVKVAARDVGLDLPKVGNGPNPGIPVDSVAPADEASFKNGTIKVGTPAGPRPIKTVHPGEGGPHPSEEVFGIALPVSESSAAESSAAESSAAEVSAAKVSAAKVSAAKSGATRSPRSSVPSAKHRASGERYVGERNGSGFVVDPRGLIVTSRHVVINAARIDVFVPSHGRYVAEIAGEDEATDLAILRLTRPPEGLTALPLGESQRLRAGDWIVAVGNPFGFAQTVTAGVVSFVGRHLPHTDLGVTSDFVQISAPLNPGSSGCPVFDLEGRVVGVTTKAAADAQGISFAVPSRTLKWALAEMERADDGVVRRGYLGIEFATSRRVDQRGQPCGGARIVRVVSGAPAELAGIKTGDVVLAVDGVPVADAAVLHQRIVQGRPGGKIALQVLRQDKILGPIQAELSEMGQARANQLN